MQLLMLLVILYRVSRLWQRTLSSQACHWTNHEVTTSQLPRPLALTALHHLLMQHPSPPPSPPPPPPPHHHQNTVSLQFDCRHVEHDLCHLLALPYTCKQPLHALLIQS